jgi:cobalt/nickel transport system permease protein
MRRLGAPRVLATQLLLAHRYFFVLAGEAGRLGRAHSLRSSGRSPGLREGATLLTQLLLRTLARAERVHTAMSCRGFDGDLTVTPPRRLAGRDLGFLVGWAAFFALARAVDIPDTLGRALTP